MLMAHEHIAENEVRTGTAASHRRLWRHSLSVRRFMLMSSTTCAVHGAASSRKQDALLHSYEKQTP